MEDVFFCIPLKVRECLRGEVLFFCTPLNVRECLRGGGWGSLYSPSRSGSVDGVRGRGWGSLHSPEGQGVFEV